MTQDTFPKRIALATDLSHRCDRALDRALMVAKAWQAELTVIHALAPPDDITLFGSLRDQPSWRRPPDPVRKVRDRMFRDLVREDPNIDATDSCAVPDHPVLSRLWSERRSLGTMVIGLTPGSEALTRRAASQLLRDRQTRNMASILRNKVKKAFGKA